MASFEDLDLTALRKSAEQGKGCDISDAFRSLHFDDVLKAAKQIAADNAKERQTDKSLPPIYFQSNSADNAVSIDIYRAPVGSSWTWGDKIERSSWQYADGSNKKSGDRGVECTGNSPQQ